MSAFALKLIAVISMLIDHTAAALFGTWDLLWVTIPALNMNVYNLCRIIGRMAFPIYCYLIIEGVRYTKSWKRYALRLGLLAALSEIPFDLALRGQMADNHQNVFLTLLLGMLLVQFSKWMSEWLSRHEGVLWSKHCVAAATGGESVEGEKSGIKRLAWYALKYPLLAAATIGVCWIANELYTDYRMGGVAMIVIMSLSLDLNSMTDTKGSRLLDWQLEPFVRVLVCAAGLAVCAKLLDSSLEWYGMAALVPILLYNGKKGYSNRAVQWGFYLFYPLHLTVLMILRLWIL